MKHSKKSLFITTVMMVVLLVVALSTATFAWYISNNTAMTTTTNLMSANSSAANIGIGWTVGATGTSISFDSVIAAESGLTPAVPRKLPISDGSISNFNNSNAAQNALYAAVDATISEPLDFVAGAFGGVDYLTIYDISDAQLAATKAPTGYDAEPYFVTVSGNYERVSHKTAWHNTNSTVAPAGTVTDAEGQTRTVGHATVTVYKVVTENAAAGEILFSTARANLPANEQAALEVGHYVISYTLYKADAYTGTTPAEYNFDYFITTNAGAMNTGDIQRIKVAGLYTCIPSATNQYVYMLSAAVAADSAVAATGTPSFYSAPVDANSYFTSGGGSATVNPLNKLDGSEAGTGEDLTQFYVTNNGTNPTGNITMSIATSGLNAVDLRVAVIINGKYVGTLASSSTTYYGIIANRAHSRTSLGTYNAVTSLSLQPLASSAAYSIQLIAWFDGVGLISGDAAKSAGFAINFNAA